MPWIALVCACVLGACSFEADYTEGTFYCRNNNACPPGLTCDEGEGICRKQPLDAGIDDVLADGGDGHIPELSCFDPGVLTSGVEVMGSTDAAESDMRSFCGNGYQFGPDVVYRITTTEPNKQFVVTIEGPLNAYVLNACMTDANTPACLGGMFATENMSRTVTAANAADYFIVVDSSSAAIAGTYTLRVVVQ